jgi:excisionase family DNA binding protein
VSGFLTVAHVADELGVSTRTVQRWIDRGELPAVRLPGGSVASLVGGPGWRAGRVIDAYDGPDEAKRPGAV